jgi:hypothetical protein
MHPISVLEDLIALDGDSGLLTWKPRGIGYFEDGAKSARHGMLKWNTRYAGREAIAAVCNGYKRGKILGVYHQYHAVVFALHHGRLPAGIVDHEDGNTLNNKPGNLREATHAENMRNCAARSGGTSVYKGVTWMAARKKWRAQISDGSGKSRHLGVFTDEIEAARAYDDAAKEVFGGFARLNLPMGGSC